ncbi:hypothetical protein [Sphingobacterium bambusae]|uniref:Uncharacterized protein n=1 Tax=Sphingobacterium bambusae TaxID=662858 RepID=A0ABW6BD70_9SPHI|nr:hypothetical protein [Sphingobacterium bambusae]WPL48629.1 hypothetical protein SCB77_22015 [Sphingobacterium bambusae]
MDKLNKKINITLGCLLLTNLLLLYIMTSGHGAAVPVKKDAAQQQQDLSFMEADFADKPAAEHGGLSIKIVLFEFK